MKRYIWFILVINGCAPVSPSVPKDQYCQTSQSKVDAFNSVNVGARSYDVESKMQQKPDSESTSNSTMVQTYVSCKQFIYNYNNDEVTTKEMK